MISMNEICPTSWNDKIKIIDTTFWPSFFKTWPTFDLSLSIMLRFSNINIRYRCHPFVS